MRQAAHPNYMYSVPWMEFQISVTDLVIAPSQGPYILELLALECTDQRTSGYVLPCFFPSARLQGFGHLTYFPSSPPLKASLRSSNPRRNAMYPNDLQTDSTGQKACSGRTSGEQEGDRLGFAGPLLQILSREHFIAN